MHSRREILCGTAAGAIAALAGLGVSPLSARQAPAPARPRVTGPIRGGSRGWPFGASFSDIGTRDYVEEEYFLEGQAASYALTGGFTPDGRWTLQPSGEAPYKTRMLVRRPRDPRRFNGTVIVEWLNVSGGYEIGFTDPPGLYDGFAYVSVSAQREGVHGFEVGHPRRRNADQPAQGLLQWDAQRYQGLSIPSDSFSYDIFSQAARAIGPGRPRRGVDPMGGLRVRTLVAAGGSQSGGRLTSYINGVQPRDNLFHALVPIVSAGSSAPWADRGPTDPRDPGFTRIRDDLRVPVFVLNSETEAPLYSQVRQPDTPLFRSWEVAGASHSGTAQIRGIREKTDRDGVTDPSTPQPRISDVVWLPTLDAIYAHVHRWVNGGAPPPSQVPMTIIGAPATIRRDRFGNALGGVRLPELEVPIARYAGTGGNSRLLGETHPFTAERLRELYPSHADYVARVRRAASAALAAGVILPYRVQEYVTEAERAAVPG